MKIYVVAHENIIIPEEYSKVDPAPFINKLINEGYVSNLTVREGGNYIFSYYADNSEVFEKYMKIEKNLED